MNPNKPIILFINHREQACGVWQYGHRLANILIQSKRYNLEYTEVDSHESWVRAHRLQASAIIYNYTDLTLPWLDLGIVNMRPEIQHFALYHEGTLPWGVTAAPGQPKRLPKNAWLLVTYSTHIDTTDALAVPRPLVDQQGVTAQLQGRLTRRLAHRNTPIISSFGFGLPQKGFKRLVERVNQEFEAALIRLHITTSAFCDDAAGKQAVDVIQSCRDVIRKPGIGLDITTHLMSDSELITWLADSSMCAFLYEDPGRWRGLSSVIDYALSTRIPVAVTRTTMFRHITDAQPSICIEDRTLRQILESGAAPLDPYREKWSHQNLIQRYEQILSECLDLNHTASEMALSTILEIAAIAASPKYPSIFPINRFLKTQNEIDACTRALKEIQVPTNMVCPPKNWDLWRALPHVRGRVLDLGSGTDGSFFLQACCKLGIGTERWGIDIDRSPPVEGAQILMGDLTNTPFRGGYFQTLVSLSVIEHGIDNDAFATECARLLSPGGRLIVSFDAWEPKIDTSQYTIYGLPWRIFGKQDIESLVNAMAVRGLVLTSPIDWTLGDAVIRPGYFSPPGSNAHYTFGLLVFEKQS